jgi:hypothetical protein
MPEVLQTWIVPVFLGLGLAAATGLRTFLPLLLLALAARFHWLPGGLNEHAQWLASTPALIALGIATAAELAADKIPAVDNALGMIGTVTRPVAGALAAGAVFSQADPWVAVVAGIIVGAPTAVAFHGAQAGTRLVSTTTTAGLANPVVSLVEDFATLLLSLVAIAAPLIAALVVVGLLAGAFWLRGRMRRRPATTAAPPN